MSYVLHYGDQKLGISDDDDIDELSGNIQIAVQSGGGWVRVGTNHGVQHVLFSAGQYVRIVERTSGERPAGTVW
jgi:hypothetical protein